MKSNLFTESIANAAKEYEEAVLGTTEELDISEGAEHQGKKVTLNKPFRTPGGPKKFAVYTKNDKGKVVIVRFGDPNLSIKRDDPKRRKAYFDRHGREAGPKWKAKYWSHWAWRPQNKLP